MKIARKLSIFLTILSLSLSVQGMNVEDTFTYSNANYLLDGYSDNNYVITSTNTVKGKGSDVIGTSSTVKSTTEWMDIVKDVGGTPLDNIVKIVHMQNNTVGLRTLFAIDTNGVLYQSSPSANIARVIYNKSPVKDVVTGSYMLSYTYIVILTEDGKIYTEFTDSHLRSSGKFNELETPHKVSKIIDMGVDSGENSNATAVLLENGDLHTIAYGAGSGYLKNESIPNIKNIYSSNNRQELILWFQNGKIKLYNIINKQIKDVDTGKGAILDIIKDSSSKEALLIKSDGVYVINTSLSLDKTQITQRPISFGGDIVLCDDGNYYKLQGTGKTLELLPVVDKATMKVWSNENPIPPTEILASFEIEEDVIYKAEEQYDLKFSIITRSQPRAFNLYYSKATTKGDISSWKPIALNVDTNLLNPTEYDTQYLDHKGNIIKGNK